MPTFHYRALTQPGEIVEGDLEAANRGALVEQLRARGLMTLRVQETGERRTSRFRFDLGRKGVLNRADEISIYRELATLLSAGLALDQSLDMLITYAARPPIAAVMSRVQASVRDGATLSSAMAAQSGTFNRFGLGMVRAGEAGGALDKALAKTAAYLENSERARQTLRSALVYPVILVVASLLSVLVIIAVIIPNFADIFRQAGVELPLATRIVVDLGHVAELYWWVPVGGGLAAVLLTMQRRQSPRGRLELDRLALRMPVLGAILTKSEVARFSYTLAMLIGNGVPLLGALSVARSALRNAALAEAVAEAEAQVKAGRTLADPLARTRVFPEHAIHLIRIGEESGNLENMLIRVSEMYEEKVQQDTKRMLTLLTPALTLGMALLIAGIIVSVLVPMLSIHQFAF